MIIGAEWDYLLQGLKCRLLFCPFAAGALTHTARQVIWFQKLLPDLKDKQASNCETGRGKRPAQLLLHTHTLTHTQTRTHSGMKDVMSIDNDNGNLTGMFNSGYRSLSHLHTRVCGDGEANGNKFLFQQEHLLSSGCSGSRPPAGCRSNLFMCVQGIHNPCYLTSRSRPEWC